jgi:secreted Zn-dependent insulinase-like peptidase
MYYRDALLASKDGGIEKSLNLAKAVQLDDIKNHFETILSNKEISLECLFSGNVSEHDAATFYNAVSSNIQKAQGITSHEMPSPSRKLIPGTFETVAFLFDFISQLMFFLFPL